MTSPGCRVNSTWRSSSCLLDLRFHSCMEGPLCIPMEQWRASHQAPGCILYYALFILFYFYSFCTFAVSPPSWVLDWSSQVDLDQSNTLCGKPESDQVTLRVLRKQCRVMTCMVSSVILHKLKRGIPWIPCAIRLILQLSSLRQGEIIIPIVCLALRSA